MGLWDPRRKLGYEEGVDGPVEPILFGTRTPHIGTFIEIKQRQSVIHFNLTGSASYILTFGRVTDDLFREQSVVWSI